MRVNRFIRTLPVIAVFIAILVAPLGAHARAAVTLPYYGPDNNVLSENGPCLRGGDERSMGGVCFNVLSSDKKVNITVSDASGMPQNVEYAFIEIDGANVFYSSGGYFCASRSLIDVPLGATYLEVRVLTQTGVATFGGACPPQVVLPPYRGIAVPTTGTITAAFS